MKQFTPVFAILLALTTMPLAAIALPTASSPVLFAQATDPEAIASAFITDLSQRQFTEVVDAFSPTAQEGLSPLTLQQNWNDLIRASGPFVRIVRTRQVPGQGDLGETVVIVTAQFANESRDIFVVLRGTDVIGFSAAQ